MNKLAIFLAAIAATLNVSAGDSLADMVKRIVPDKRQTVLEVTADTLPSRTLVVRGVTSELGAKTALFDQLSARGFQVVDSLRVYPTDSWGLVSIPVASLRTRPAHAGEMATQAVMGTPVRVLEHTGEWLRAQTPDGYIAYVPDSSVAPLTPEQMKAWRADAGRRVVTDLWQTRAFTSPTASGPRDVVTDLVLGAIVQTSGAAPQNGRVEILLPDGRRGWADESSLQPVAEWASQTFDAQKILTTAYSMEGTPYLWGGTSTKAIDCSGLVKVSYLSNGLILLRDASQQALTGERLDAEAWRDYEPADLMFFGNRDTGRVTHVALYDSEGRYVHSSGRVKRNSLDPDSPLYLYSPLHSVRIRGHEGTPGIVRAANHPWLFEK